MSSPVPTTDLTSLMPFIAEGFPFTPEHYPGADFSTPGAALAFAARHSMAHMAKTTGKIAAEVEEYDHTGTMDVELLRNSAAKQLVTAINLARALGMSPAELAARVPFVMKVV